MTWIDVPLHVLTYVSNFLPVRRDLHSPAKLDTAYFLGTGALTAMNADVVAIVSEVRADVVAKLLKNLPS